MSVSRNFNPTQVKRAVKKIAKTRDKDSSESKSASLRHGRVPRACRIIAISIYFPPIHGLHNAADFVSVAWRSRKVFQRVYARVQRELGRASASLDIKETPRRPCRAAPRRAAAFSSYTSPHRAYLSAAPSYYLFAFLSHAVCRSSLPLSDIFMPRLAARQIFFPTLSPRRAESFPVKFFGFLHDAEKSLSFHLFLHLFSSRLT